MAKDEKEGRDAPVVSQADRQPAAVTAPPEGSGSVTLRTRGLVGEYRHGIEDVYPVTKHPRNFSKENAEKILKQPNAGRYVVEVKEED